MRLRDVARLVCSSALVGATIIVGASCGGSGSTSGHGNGMDATNLNFGDGSNNGCKPATCASLGYTCGDNADGCGGLIHCGTCEGGDFCGGGGFSKCGSGAPQDGSSSSCTPKTCADYPAGTCGQQSDSCGGLTAACSANEAGGLCDASMGEFCGGGGPGLCGVGNQDGGDAGPCVAKTCSDFPSGTCGQQSDGCGGLTQDCLTCTAPQFCGGGSAPSTCGGILATDGGDAGPACVPLTCASVAAGTCGVQGDGCGGTFGPCTVCAAPGFCGGGGASRCGGDAGAGTTASDGGDGSLTSCNPKTCAAFPAGTCGQQSDGCGGLTANCGTCTSPAFCGGNPAAPGTCGGNDGHSADGSVASTCQPATCQGKGYNCGVAGDGCGGIMGPCGSLGGGCQAPLACGAGGQPNICGTSVACTGLCPQQQLCDGGSATLTGKVVAGTVATYLPAGVTYGDPVPNVLVYVPNRTSPPYVDPFTPRSAETQAQQCSTCGADVSGDPLVETNTLFDGTFTLQNVPVGSSIPLVIQLGRWRRVFTVNVTCGSNPVVATGIGTDGGTDGAMPSGILRMPRTQYEGDIPLTAISTGSVDAMECVLLKMGVDPSEFVAYSATATGRIQMYQGNGAVATNGGATQPETTLMGTTTTSGTYNDYDQVILPCWGQDPTQGGSPNIKTPAELANLVTYGNNGGHFFATHYSFAWLYQNAPYSTTATWNVDSDSLNNNLLGTVSNTVPVSNPGLFLNWLTGIGALATKACTGNTPGANQVCIANARHDSTVVQGQSVAWITGTDPNPPKGVSSDMLLHYTFDTPVGATAQCGHAIYSDFHVTNSATGDGTTSGSTCTQNSDCASNVCLNQGAGCTRNNQCASNSCANNGTCNGLCQSASFPSQANLATYCGQTPMTPQEKILEYMIWDLASCVPPPPTNTCTKKTCANYPTNPCGQQSDGCGGLTADCNPCPTGTVCGGGGVAGVCGAPDSGTCTAKTCSSFPGTCGQQADGCGGLTNDCTCPTGQTCVSGQCTSPGGSSSGGTGCVPLTCTAYPNTCGQQADGCGGLTQDCMPCPSGQTCGGCGTPGQCCTPPSTGCTPKTCADYPTGTCGPQSDGCGGTTPVCGTCTPPQTCGGGGTPGMCGGNSGCVPLTCAQQNIACGPAGDGCGNVIQCPSCPAGQTCGGGGPNMCGTGTCTPKTCAELNVQCGPTGDGCGGLISTCGSCATGQTCGGGGQPGVCSTIAM